MAGPLRYPAAVVLVGLGLLAVFEKSLARRRPGSLELAARTEVAVMSASDDGPGSLREAIFAAARAEGRVRIEIRTERIVLRTPLPPIVNPAGVVITASTPGAEIDARAAPTGPVLDVSAPGSVVQGLRIRNADGPCILVKARGARVQHATLIDCEAGVYVAEGVADTFVEDSTFEKNGTGVRVDAAAVGVSLVNNHFRSHDAAAVWAVSASPPRGPAAPAVLVRRNRFEADHMSVVLVNVPGLVEDNQFARAEEAAVYLTGPGIVRRNRIQASARVGLFADGPEGALIEDNEIDHSAAVGILVRQPHNTAVRGNRVYQNAYGIAVVFTDRRLPSVIADNLVLDQRDDGLYIVGGSPIVRDNRVLGSHRAGLRVLDYVPLEGARVQARPVVQDNVLRDNGTDDPVRGEYREPRIQREPR